MEIEKLKRNTITRLKSVKKEQGLTIPQIMNMLEQSGEFVSEATVKKIFQDGSEEKNFRYQDSVAPLANVLLDEYGADGNSDDLEGLRQIIREKNRMIESLMIKLEEQKDIYAKRDAMYKERQGIYEHHIARIEAEIDRLNEHLSGCERRIERKDIVLERLLNAYLIKEESGIVDEQSIHDSF